MRWGCIGNPRADRSRYGHGGWLGTYKASLGQRTGSGMCLWWPLGRSEVNLLGLRMRRDLHRGANSGRAVSNCTFIAIAPRRKPSITAVARGPSARKRGLCNLPLLWPYDVDAEAVA